MTSKHKKHPSDSPNKEVADAAKQESEVDRREEDLRRRGLLHDESMGNEKRLANGKLGDDD